MATTNIPGLQEALTRLADPKAVSGSESPEGVREYAVLPFDRELHVTIASAEYKESNGGAPGLRLVYDVTEEGFEGSRVWDSIYFTGHAFQGERLGTILAAEAAVHEISFDGDIEVLAPQLAGGKLIVALKPNDRSPQYPQVRWLNRDIGQAAKTGLKAPKVTTPKADTGPIVLPGQAAPTPEPAPASTGVSAAPVGLGGIKLPGT